MTTFADADTISAAICLSLVTVAGRPDGATLDVKVAAGAAPVQVLHERSDVAGHWEAAAVSAAAALGISATWSPAYETWLLAVFPLAPRHTLPAGWNVRIEAPDGSPQLSIIASDLITLMPAADAVELLRARTHPAA